MLSPAEQAEKIADKFAEVSQQYDPLTDKDIQCPSILKGSVPTIYPGQVREYLKKIKTNISTVPGDIPSRLVKEFALELSYPLCDIIVTCIRKGQWPVLWKRELVTPIAKVYPPTDRSLLRKISGLLQFDKVAEKIIAEWIPNIRFEDD